MDGRRAGCAATCSSTLNDFSVLTGDEIRVGQVGLRDGEHQRHDRHDSGGVLIGWEILDPPDSTA